MATMTQPPFIPITGYPTGYPSPTRRLGQAWAYAWLQLGEAQASRADHGAGPGYLDGVVLATEAGELSGLATGTMISLFTRAATAGLLERTHADVVSTRGPRRRTFYRIPETKA